ncbi:MAG: copper resistance protein CopD [Pseudonocardiaceae bacterium]|nr:copper resistance protein CopD [Pseudonocardiaceae bacterium]
MTAEATEATDTAPEIPARSGLGVLLAVGVLLAGAIGAGLTVLLAGDVLAALGLPDPGLFTRAALPATMVLAECAAVVTVGSLLLGAFLVPPQSSGYLDVGGYAALRTARASAAVWLAAAVAMMPLSVADAVGRPVTDVLAPAVLADLAPRLTMPGAWAITAGIAMVLAAGATVALSWGATVGLFGLSLFGLLPVALTGHSASGGAHDIATNSLIYHLLAAALWVGGLIAVLAHLGSRGEHAGLAASRFSRLALVCWIVMAASGVTNALMRIEPGQLLSNSYGALVLAKIAALSLLGVFGYLHRRGSVAAVARRGDRSAMLRLGSGEILLMLATIGLAVGLSRTPPPAVVTAEVSRTELLLGYDLAGAPTAMRLLFDWRFDLVFGVLALVLAWVYIAGVRRLRRRGDAWSVGRTVAWLAGCATVLVATSSGIGKYSMAMFSVHMGQHMLLTMLAPVLLVLGGPVVLALRALPAAGATNPPGAREWLLAVVHSGFVRLLTHPLVILPLYVGSYYALYLTGLFDAAVYSHGAHLAMNAHFLLIGYAFFWPIIGIDPAPRRLPHLAKLGLLLASLPFHAFFGIILRGSSTVVGGDFYRALSLPFVPDLLEDQLLAGNIAWTTGEIPLLLVLIALLVQWSRSDERDARRFDRKANADGNADLAAYNAMLAQLADEDRGRTARQ